MVQSRTSRYLPRSGGHRCPRRPCQECPLARSGKHRRDRPCCKSDQLHPDCGGRGKQVGQLSPIRRERQPHHVDVGFRKQQLLTRAVRKDSRPRLPPAALVGVRVRGAGDESGPRWLRGAGSRGVPTMSVEQPPVAFRVPVRTPGRRTKPKRSELRRRT